MYFILCITAMLGYSIQGTLMVSLYRQYDSQEALSIRGLCLIISMTPLLLFVPAEAFAQLPNYLGWIALAALLASLGAWPGFLSFRYLPVGIATAFLAAFNSLLIGLYGLFIFDERMTAVQFIIIGFMLLCVVLVGITKSPVHLAQVSRIKLGVFLCILFGLFISAAFIILSYVSRRLNPLLTAYSWEAGIGFISFIILIIRKSIYRKPLITIPPIDWGKIFLFSWPTLIGTGSYMIAVTLGPVGIVAAIGSTSIIISTVMARFLYKESLSRQQWALLLLICLLIAMLKLAQ